MAPDRTDGRIDVFIDDGRITASLFRSRSHFGCLLELSSLLKPIRPQYARSLLMHAFQSVHGYKTLQILHMRMFGEWIGFSFEKRIIDLQCFLSSDMDGCSPEIFRHDIHAEWTIPDEAMQAEAMLFNEDFELLIRILIGNQCDTNTNIFDSRLLTTIQFIERNVGCKESATHLSIRPDMIAQCLNLSTGRLRHLFKHWTGDSIARFSKRVKLRHASRLLRVTYLNIAQIAASLEYSASTNFVIDFRKFFGITPRQYRTRWLTILSGIQHK